MANNNIEFLYIEKRRKRAKAKMKEMDCFR